MANTPSPVDSRILEGVSKSSLAEIFELNYRTVAKRIRPCPPSGRRGNSEIWTIKAVAPYLVNELLPKRKDDVVEDEQALSPGDEKDLWDARLKKQKFEENDGDLWRTEQVITALADIFKSTKLQILLFSDHIERECGLTEDQRTIIQRKSDELLQSLIEELQDKYADRQPDIAD